MKNGGAIAPPFVISELRAGNGTRTRDPNLGKVVLYQLSHVRVDPPLYKPTLVPGRVHG